MTLKQIDKQYSKEMTALFKTFNGDPDASLVKNEARIFFNYHMRETLVKLIEVINYNAYIEDDHYVVNKQFLKEYCDAILNY